MIRSSNRLPSLSTLVIAAALTGGALISASARAQPPTARPQPPLTQVTLICPDVLDAAHLLPLARPLAGRDAVVMSDADTNCLVLVDEPARVQRLRDLVARLEERARQRGARPVTSGVRRPRPPGR